MEFQVEAPARAMDADAKPEVRSRPIRRSESRFEGAGGRSLFCCAWQPASPRRIVVLVHGFGEHILRYDPLAMWLAERGSAVFGFDLRGHGRSSGARGHVERFDQYLDDLDLFLARVREQLPDLPLHLVGHSMGGLVVTVHACEREPALTSLATSGAALALSQEVSGVKKWLARALRSIAPRVAMAVGIDSRALSTDPAIAESYDADPFVHDRMTASHAAEMMDAVERMQGQGAAIAVPMRMMHGEHDRLCLASGSVAFYESLPGATGESGAPAAELTIYPGLRHEIFNEPERERVYEDLHRWHLCTESGERPPG